VTRTEWACAACFVAAAAVTPLAGLLARRLRIVDRPGVLKPQQKAVPYLGGIGILAGLLVGAFLSRPVYALPLLLALALGTADDAKNLAPAIRFAGQMVVGVVAGVVTDTRFTPLLSAILVAAVAVLLMNGVNLIDGLDSLAGGVCAVAGAGLAVMLGGDARVFAAALALSAAGFLLYNRPPARIYMGDGGAYLMAVALTLALASSWSRSGRVEVGLACLMVAALPATEVVLAIARRLRDKTPVVLGDRGHPYDRLVERGWPKPAAALTYVTVEVVLVAVALAVYQARTQIPPVAAVASTAALILAAMVATLLGRRRIAPTDRGAV
jgi:UDP-GlcNAc:undecaprenyl-phosphate/decaprenyl-phosphate GlcNAc-1-phosphate transferase